MAVRYIGKNLSDISGAGIVDNDSVAFHEGGQAVVTGLNQSGLATGLTNVETARTFGGNVGGSGGFFRAKITGKGRHRGSGEFFYHANGATDACALWHQDGPGISRLVGGGTHALLDISMGLADVSGDVIVTTIRGNGGSLNQLYHATANTNIYAARMAQFTSGRGFSGSAYFSGGMTALFRRVDTSATLPTGGSLFIFDATVKWCGGNITKIWLMHPNAKFDGREAPVSYTITDIEGYASAYDNSNIDSIIPDVTVTKTNAFVPWCGAAGTTPRNAMVA